MGRVRTDHQNSLRRNQALGSGAHNELVLLNWWKLTVCPT